MDLRVRARPPAPGRKPAPKLARRRPAPAATPAKLDAAGVLGLQRVIGNASTARIVARASTRLGAAPRGIQRAPKPPPPVLQSLAVTNAVAVTGSTDQFVAAKGAAGVTVDATVDDPAKVKPGSIKWSGGSSGANAAQRLVGTGSIGAIPIKATAGGVTKTLTVHVPATAPPVANPAAGLTHTKIGASAPGTNFGLTVVTIGQQGVTRPTFTVGTHINGNRWAFRLREVRHGFKVGVDGQGRIDIFGPGDPDVKPSTIGRILTDLDPPAPGTPNGPPRGTFWSRAITVAHEQAHVDRFYLDPAFWPASMALFETTVETTAADFDPTKPAAASAAGVRTANMAAWEAAVTTEHNAADAAEIGGSEVAAHGVSNPMYTALLAAIRNTVVPPAPTGFAAATGGGGSVTVTWAVTVANETGFVIERRVGKGAFTAVGAVGAAARTFTDAGLPVGTKATYRVRAAGVKGNSAASGAQTVTTVP